MSIDSMSARFTKMRFSVFFCCRKSTRLGSDGQVHIKRNAELEIDSSFDSAESSIRYNAS